MALLSHDKFTDRNQSICEVITLREVIRCYKNKSTSKINLNNNI